MTVKAHPRLVGAFVLGAVALLLVAIALLSSEGWFVRKDRFTVYFPGSVKGLNRGASVTFRGVKVGEVIDVKAFLTGREDPLIQIEAVIEIRANVVETPKGVPPLFLAGATPEEFANGLLGRGIRARLMSASLLTGQRYVDLDFLPKEPARFAALHPRYPELPTTPTALEKLGDRADDFIAKLVDLPLADMLNDVREAIGAARKLLESPELKEVIAKASGAARRMDGTLADLQKTLGVADKTLGTVGSEASLTGARSTRDPGEPARHPGPRRDEPRDHRGHLPGHRRYSAHRHPRPRRDHAYHAGAAQPRRLHPDPSRGGCPRQGAGEGEEVMRRPLTLVVAALAFSGCVSLKRTPEARFFALRSMAEPPATPAAASGPGLVGVLPVLLPAYLERPQVVTWAAPGEVRIDEFLRWAEPLDVAVSRVVGENLGALLPSLRVVRAPWGASTPLRCRVRLELARFGPQPGGEVELAGRWALLPGRGEQPLVAHPFEQRRDPRTGGSGPADPNGQIEAMSALLGELSREIAAAVLALPAPEPEGPKP